jgi:hypothetical protein
VKKYFEKSKFQKINNTPSELEDEMDEENSDERVETMRTLSRI